MNVGLHISLCHEYVRILNTYSKLDETLFEMYFLRILERYI